MKLNPNENMMKLSTNASGNFGYETPLDCNGNGQADVYLHLNRQGVRLRKLEESVTELTSRLGPVLKAPSTQDVVPPNAKASAHTPLGIDIDLNNERLETLNQKVADLLKNLGI